MAVAMRPKLLFNPDSPPPNFFQHGGQAGQEEIGGARVWIEEQFWSHVDSHGAAVFQYAAKGLVEPDGGGDVDGLSGDGGVRAINEHEHLRAALMEQVIGIVHGNLDANAGASGDDFVV